ncbi:MAG: hypothetical protein M1813_004521 [Trichoglossum hirsutum]|nr:MAG: hypothetical protein M1813_004521 [Trichoglossum hirsutum]
MDRSEQDLLEELPWKHVGYRVFSRWIASDPALFIVRRFGALNTRVILCLQDEIARHEEELDRLDEKFRQAEPDDTNNGSFRNDPCQDRKILIEKTLRKKLAKYSRSRTYEAHASTLIENCDDVANHFPYYMIDKFINNYAQLVSRPPLNPTDINLVRRWFDEVRPAAVDEVEASYIRRGDDLVPVQPKTRSWFRKRLESNFLFSMRMMQSLFGRKPADGHIIGDGWTIWEDDKKMEMFSSLMTGFVGLAMLIGPLWILMYVAEPRLRLGVITSFVVLFYVAVAVATTARPWESLAATAAYSAVLMVFLQSK